MDDTSSRSSEPDDGTRRTGIDLRWPRQPYPGLRPFQVDETVDESLVFFGREKQKDEILRRLNASHVVYIVGPSGSGKSSLIKAGVIPALRAGLLTSAGHRWKIAQTRPERRPLAQLAEALAELLIDKDDTEAFADRREAIEILLRQEESALWLIADSISERHAAEGRTQTRTLLLVDQFEEAFAPGILDRTEVNQFFRILTRYFNKPHPDLYLIIAMRTGYVGSTAAHPDVAEMLNSTAYLTPILTPSQMAVAISRPAETYGGAVEAELVQAILDDAAMPREDIADQLPLVQHALFWMWERTWRSAGLKSPPKPGDDPPAVVPPLSLAEFREHDGLKGIMQRHAEDLYASAVVTGGSSERLCELVFKRLCERDIERRYRRTPPTMSELQELTGASEDELRAVIAPFIAPNAALLSVRQQAGSAEDVIDINHESLIRQWDRLRGWADEEAREVATFRELVGSSRQWEQSNRDERHLRTGGQLELVESFWKRMTPSAAWAKRYRTVNRKRSLAEDLPLVESYVAASKDLRKRNTRKMHVLAWGSASLVVAIMALTSYMLLQSNQNANIVATVGTFVGEERPIDALLLAEHATEENFRITRRMEDFLRSTVTGFRLDTELRGSDFTTISYSPDGDALLIGDGQGRLHVWRDGDPHPTRVEIDRPLNQNRKWFNWSPDGDFVFVSDASGRGPASVFKVVSGGGDGSERMSLEWQFTVGLASRRAQFANSGEDGGRYRLVTFGRNEVKLWEWQKDSRTPLETKITDGSWGSDATFSQDGSKLAVETGGEVLVYDVATPEIGTGFENGAEPNSNKTEIFKFSTGATRSKLAFLSGPDERNVLVYGTDSGVVTLLDVDEEKDVRKIDGRGKIRTLASSPDGKWIATSGQDGVIWLSPTSVGMNQDTEERERLPGISEIEELSFSSDSAKLASVSKDGVVRIWWVEPQSAVSTAGFDRDNWIETLQELHPVLIDTGNGKGVVPLDLHPKLKCLVSPGTPECS
jgi:WD40 repeat protein/energy-coupling factor transporter ATP-binding protein EcfA2